MSILLPWSLLLVGSIGAVVGWRRHVRQGAELKAIRVEHAQLASALAADTRGQRHSLSGLPTREPLLAAIAVAARGTLGVVALADFDRLATFDPALADRVMLALVDRLQRTLGDRRLLAHVDRGQFAIWFDGDVPPDEARAEVAAIAGTLRDAVPDGARDIVPQIVSAHARWPDDDADPPALLARATAALTVGAEGRGSVADVAAEARERYLLEQDLRQAIEEHQFHLAFQPLVEVGEEDGAVRVVGAEALVRWHHPRRAEVSPATFVPLLEQMGMADRLGEWALDRGLAAAAGWPAPWRVAVNVSAMQLERGDLSGMVEGMLARHRLPAARLELELTETVATADPARAAALFDRLRGSGVRIAIDDFGTGYSSFSAVRRLQFDKIKIDREFVTDVHRRLDSQAICQSIIALARGLGAAVLAEGVEDVEEYRWLHRAGCRLFQGYYFAEPLDPAAFVAFASRKG